MIWSTKIPTYTKYIFTNMAKEKESYDWWMDPANKEAVEAASWWEHERNKEFFYLPISVVKSDTSWTAACNEATEEVLGKYLHGVGSGETKEEAIRQMFESIRVTYHFAWEAEMRFQRWVPFRKGNWGHTGGKWFSVFGYHVYFRYGKGMRGGGFYIPFTKLNVRLSSDWAAYRRWKRDHKFI